MQPFTTAAWREHVLEWKPAWRRPAHTYRVDYEDGADSGHITIRSDKPLGAGLVTQARSSLEAEGIQAASIRRIVAV